MVVEIPKLITGEHKRDRSTLKAERVLQADQSFAESIFSALWVAADIQVRLCSNCVLYGVKPRLHRLSVWQISVRQGMESLL